MLWNCGAGGWALLGWRTAGTFFGTVRPGVLETPVGPAPHAARSRARQEAEKKPQRRRREIPLDLVIMVGSSHCPAPIRCQRVQFKAALAERRAARYSRLTPVPSSRSPKDFPCMA